MNIPMTAIADILQAFTRIHTVAGVPASNFVPILKHLVRCVRLTPNPNLNVIASITLSLAKLDVPNINVFTTCESILSQTVMNDWHPNQQHPVSVRPGLLRPLLDIFYSFAHFRYIESSSLLMLIQFIHVHIGGMAQLGPECYTVAAKLAWSIVALELESYELSRELLDTVFQLAADNSDAFAPDEKRMVFMAHLVVTYRLKRSCLSMSTAIKFETPPEEESDVGDAQQTEIILDKIAKTFAACGFEVHPYVVTLYGLTLDMVATINGRKFALAIDPMDHFVLSDINDGAQLRTRKLKASVALKRRILRLIGWEVIEISQSEVLPMEGHVAHLLSQKLDMPLEPVARAGGFSSTIAPFWFHNNQNSPQMQPNQMTPARPMTMGMPSPGGTPQLTVTADAAYVQQFAEGYASPQIHRGLVPQAYSPVMQFGAPAGMTTPPRGTPEQTHAPSPQIQTHNVASPERRPQPLQPGGQGQGLTWVPNHGAPPFRTQPAPPHPQQTTGYMARSGQSPRTTQPNAVTPGRIDTAPSGPPQQANNKSTQQANQPARQASPALPPKTGSQTNKNPHQQQGERPPPKLQRPPATQVQVPPRTPPRKSPSHAQQAGTTSPPKTFGNRYPSDRDGEMRDGYDSYLTSRNRPGESPSYLQSSPTNGPEQPTSARSAVSQSGSVDASPHPGGSISEPEKPSHTFNPDQPFGGRSWDEIEVSGTPMNLQNVPYVRLSPALSRHSEACSPVNATRPIIEIQPDGPSGPEAPATVIASARSLMSMGSPGRKRREGEPNPADLPPSLVPPSLTLPPSSDPELRGDEGGSLAQQSAASAYQTLEPPVEPRPAANLSTPVRKHPHTAATDQMMTPMTNTTTATILSTPMAAPVTEDSRPKASGTTEASPDPPTETSTTAAQTRDTSGISLAYILTASVVLAVAVFVGLHLTGSTTLPS